MSIVACYRNTTNKNCSWVSSEENITIDYDIWLVNGDPIYKKWNPVEHQFSFEEHDIFETFMAFLGVYILIVPFYFYVYSKQRHSLTKFLLVITCTEAFGIFCNFIHVAVFASNGVGVKWIAVLGNAIDTLAQCLFMLSLLLLAKGWMITQHRIRGKKVVFSLWGVYTLLNCILFLWNLVSLFLVIILTVNSSYSYICTCTSIFSKHGKWIFEQCKEIQHKIGTCIDIVCHVCGEFCLCNVLYMWCHLSVSDKLG